MILFLTDDLTFPFRVRGAAQPLGVELKTVRASEAANTPGEFALVIIDLPAAGPEVVAVIKLVRERWPTARTVGFGPHVDVALLEKAQAAGCELVLPRSQFAQRLNEIVTLAKGG